MNTGLRELLTTRLWNMLPSVLHNYRVVIENNINASVPLNINDTPDSFLCCKSQGYENTLLAGDADMIFDYCDIAADDEVVNVICVNGPVTRNGDGCSVGSKQHRDKILRATRMPQVVGHLFMIDTPGGSAFSKNDYSQAIEAAHEAGQPVVALIDGMCCSAGMALASLCDEIYYVHGNDEVGCIGTMAAFYSNKNGDINTIDQSTYHELYDPESTEKNIEFRSSAEGDDSLIIEELRKDGEEFRGMVKAHRPNATDEHLHGKVFKASEVEGILVDGKSTFEGCISRILDLAQSAVLGASSAPVSSASPLDTTEPPCDSPDDDDDDDDDEEDDPKDKCGGGKKKDKCGDKPRKDKCGDPKKHEDNHHLSPTPQSVYTSEIQSHSSIDNSQTTITPVSSASPLDNPKQTTMKQYSHINAALSVEALAVTEDGSFYCNGPLAETLEARLAEAQQNEELLKANTEAVNNLNAKVNELKAEAEANATAYTDKESDLNNQLAVLGEEKETLAAQLAEQATKLEDANNSIAVLGEEKTNLENELAALREEKANLEQQLADKQSEIEELSKASIPAATPAPAPAPAPEQQFENRTLVQSIYSKGMTIEEKAQAREDRMAALKAIK